MPASRGRPATDTVPTSDSLPSSRAARAAPAAGRGHQRSAAGRGGVAAVSTRHHRLHPCHRRLCWHSVTPGTGNSGHPESRHRQVALLVERRLQVSLHRGLPHLPTKEATKLKDAISHSRRMVYKRKIFQNDFE